MFEHYPDLFEMKANIETALKQCLPLSYPEKIFQSMRYSLFAGGKRLRPILCLTACEMLGGKREMAMPTACAFEMIHTMSLIHDDLPAMDNDDIRRGCPSNHLAFGDATAILAGDGLLAYAFEHIATQSNGVDSDRLLQVIARIAFAAGPKGMAGGQIVDLDCQQMNVTPKLLQYIHYHKTAILFEACVACGAILAGAGSTEIDSLSRYARNLGLAYQMIDDIADEKLTSKRVCTIPGGQHALEKGTSLHHIQCVNLSQKAKHFIERARTELTLFADRATALAVIANSIEQRLFDIVDSKH